MAFKTAKDRMENVNYRLWVYLLPIPILVFYTLCLTGCVSNSPGIAGIFTVQLAGKSSSPQVRVNYFGLCVSASDKLSCQASSGKSVNQLLTSFSDAGGVAKGDLTAATKLLGFALTIQSKITMYLLAGAGVLYFIALVLVLMLKRHFKASQKDKAISEKRRRSLRRSSLLIVWMSVGFVLASALSITQTTGAMAFVTQMESTSDVKIKAGKALVVLQWLIFAVSALFAAGVSGIFRKEGGSIGSAGSSQRPGGMGGGMGGGVPPPPPPPG